MVDFKIYIKELFIQALDKLYQNDYSLISRKCCERSIVFRLGIYLENIFSKYSYNVDCEYNKKGLVPKELIGKRFNYPDIIIHKREDNQNNILIVEVKTSNSGQPKYFEKDVYKLRGFTSEKDYLYKLGVHLYIDINFCRVVWYENRKIQEYCKYNVVNNGNSHFLQLDQTKSYKKCLFDSWYIKHKQNM